MRERIAERIRKWEPTQGVVLSAEYRIKTSSEAAFTQALKDLEAGIKDLPSLAHFSYYYPPRSERTKDLIQYDTYEEWTTAVAFLNYWRSETLQRFHQAVESLCARPTQIELYAGRGGVSAAPPTPPRSVRPFKTGQTRSWNSDGVLRRLGAESGDDGYWEAGETYRGTHRFRDNQNGTITDTLTDLTWLRNANVYGEVPWPAAVHNATQLASGAPGLTDGSKPGDWRLPNVNEMQSLLDLDKSFGPALGADSPFINLEATNYWTSSSVALAPPLGWFVALSVGPPVFDLKINSMRMWPVRGRSSKVARTGQKMCFDIWGRPVDCNTEGRGQDGSVQAGAPWPAERFTDGDDEGTVTDNLTGLVWLKNANTFGRLSWQDALDACDTLEAGCYGLDDESKRGDWRLPNVNELRGLVDYSQYAPALPKPNPFNDVKSSLYWSSTTVASAPRFARFVFIGVGPSVWDHKSVLMNVWACRDPR